MSVVIAAPQAKPPTSAPATSTDNASTTDAVAIGGDFASLLLGQLTVATDLQPAIPESTSVQMDDASSITELAPQDAALMLAALGVAPREAAPAPKAIDLHLPDSNEKTLLPSVTGISQAVPLNNNASADALDGRQAETGGNPNGFTPSQALGVGDRPAKVAATDFALPKAEALPAGSTTEQAQANGAAGISPPPPVAAHRNEGVLKVETPVHDRAWAGDFSQKVVWLASNDKQVAQLTLNPPQMGPIEISLNLNKDGASVFFASQNAEVREAIETALPRLREMLAGAGIELGQANVSAESFRQQAGNENARHGTPRWMADNAILAGDSAHSLSGQAIMAQRGNGLVDTFA